MRGHIKSAGPGTWRIVLYLGKGADGKKKQKWLTFRGTKKDAEAQMARMINEIENGQYVAPSKMTVEEYLKFWLKTRCKPKLAPLTYKSYSDTIDLHFIPAFGNKLLSKLNPLMIESYYALKLESGLKGTSVLYHHRILHNALDYAVRKKILAQNPCDAVDPPIKSNYEAELLSLDQFKELLKKVEGTALYIPVIIGAATGMRRGEICALQWDDFDEEAGTLRVRYAIKRVKGPLELGPTKTNRSRVIALTEMTIGILKKHHKQQKELSFAKHGSSRTYDYIVCWDDDGRPYDPNFITRAFRKILRELKISDKVRFHNLRHGYATLLLSMGVEMKIISELLGHANITTTSNIYTHVNLEMQREAIKGVDSALFGQQIEKEALSQ